MIGFTIGLRAVLSRSARHRNVLFLIVGLILAAGIAAPIIASGIKTAEQARADQLVETTSPFPYASVTHRFHGSSITVIRIPPGGDGLWQQLGQPGRPADADVWVSPALADLIQATPVVADWFPSDEAHVLTQDSVGTSGQLTAFVVSDGAAEAGALFPGDPGFRSSGALTYFQISGLILFCGLPALALVLAAGRFGRRERVERFDALRSIGMDQINCRVVSAIEVSVPAFVGVISTVSALVAIPVSRMRLPIVGRQIFGSDARLSPVDALVVASLSLLVLVAVGSLLGGGVVHRSTRRSLKPSSYRVGLAGAVLFMVGLALAAWSWSLALPGDWRRTVALVLLGVGLPSATAVSAAILARLACARSLPVPGLVAMRRVAAHAQTATRLAAVVGVATFSISVADAVSTGLRAPTADWSELASTTAERDVTARIETLDTALFQPSAPPPSTVGAYVVEAGLWAPDQAINDRPTGSVLIASCAQLEELFDAVSGCDGTRQVLTTANLPPQAQLRNRDTMGSAALDIPTGTVSVSSTEVAVDADMIVPHDDPILIDLDDPDAVGGYVTTEASDEAWDLTQAWVVASSPTHRIENTFTASATSDQTSSWVLLGIFVILIVVGLAILLVAADDRQSMHHWTPLRSLGFSTREMIYVEVFSSMLVAAVAHVLAFCAALSLSAAYLSPDEDSPLPVGRSALAAFAGLLIVTIAAAISTTSTAKKLNG